MYKLMTLEDERKDKIINAGLKIFADYGYDETSTAQLAKEAGVTKPLLFHYIVSKKEFFLFLNKLVWDKILVEYQGMMANPQADFLEHLRKAYRWKIALMQKIPAEYNFSLSVVDKPPRGDLWIEFQELQSNYLQYASGEIFKDVDRSLFRTDIDIDKAMEMIQWVVTGYGQRILTKGVEYWRHIDVELVGRDYDTYIDELRKLFYKNTA